MYHARLKNGTNTVYIQQLSIEPLVMVWIWSGMRVSFWHGYTRQSADRPAQRLRRSRPDGPSRVYLLSVKLPLPTALFIGRRRDR